MVVRTRWGEEEEDDSVTTATLARGRFQVNIFVLFEIHGTAGFSDTYRMPGRASAQTVPRAREREWEREMMRLVSVILISQ